MLNIYYGAETTNKEKFMFDNIKGRTLLLVPDQFSLQAERDAFFYLEKNSLLDIRIVDFNTLGHKVVREVGGKAPGLIDKYGSQMMLTKILGEIDKELTVYRGLSWKSSFIDRVYGVISDMKRYGVTHEKLEKVIAELNENTYLKYKLTDISKIYDKYQKSIEGKYLDVEDYILFYGEKIMNSAMIEESDIWIYGFDTFTPKNIIIIERLLKTARSVNIVMTYEENNEVFMLTKQVMNRLVKAAEDINEEVSVKKIKCSEKKAVWGYISGSCNAENIPSDAVTLVKTTGQYAEAERAAAYILNLVRNQGYKFGDIVVVCNDMEGRGNILSRTFSRWGIPVFIDKKRSVMHHPAVSCMLAVMEIVSKGYKTEAVMRMIKSGLMGFTGEECDLLENYVNAFKIRGTMWSSEFIKSGGKYSHEELEIINGLRATITETVEKAKVSIGKYNTASEKTKGLYRFLDNDFNMPERIEMLMAKQEKAGFAEGAAETAQSWNVICGILDQIVEILGDESVSNEELLKLMIIGMERVEIGLVPTSSDRVIIGTLQRTRLSRVKVLIIAGANAGVLPMESIEEGLISDREKALLEEMDIEISKRDEVVGMEERLAIYRTLYLPEEKIYISCAEMTESGEPQRPSELFENIKKYIENKGDYKVLEDLGKSEDIFEMLTSKKGTLEYVTEALRGYRDSKNNEDIDEKWLEILKWYENNQPEDIARVKEGMLFDNNIHNVGKEFSDALYRGDRDKLTVSASRLEKYSSCPFAHFVMYGLRAETPVIYEMGAREIGDIYHYCLMTLSKSLTSKIADGMAVDHPDSPWMTVTEQQCREKVAKIIMADMDGFHEGIMGHGKEESYRTDRIIEICGDAAWSMVKQVKKGHIKSMFFEQPFGRGSLLPPVSVDVGDQEVLIQGKIDRVDVLHEGAVRIIDYKTGSDTVDPEYIRNGYKLQLMIYMEAAAGTCAESAEPAGVFYFKIDDLATDAEKNSVANAEDGKSSLMQRLDEAYKLVGIVLNDEKLIGAMDSSLDMFESGSSTVIPVKITGKDNNIKPSAGGHLMERSEFDELMVQVNEHVKRICSEICDGKLDIRPKKEKKQSLGGHLTACRYCEYKSICMFDTSFDGCRYEMI